jgi:hypothetical protein
MKKLFVFIAVFLAIALGASLFLSKDLSETKGKWHAVYYPDGCLSCDDNYIWSPFFNSANECIGWVHAKAETRNNGNDVAECGFDCKKDYVLGGIMVCKETVDVLGNPSF